MGTTSWKHAMSQLWGDGKQILQSAAPAVFVFLAETAALAILLDSKGSGTELIQQQYHLHSHEPRVAEALCLLMNEMVQYGEMAAATCWVSPSLPALKSVKLNSSSQGHVSCSQERLSVWENCNSSSWEFTPLVPNTTLMLKHFNFIISCLLLGCSFSSCSTGSSAITINFLVHWHCRWGYAEYEVPENGKAAVWNKIPVSI